uniref:ornithine carbamoyltransferase n=1 Tax=Harpagon schusteri TaxID=1129785 RepID=A0A142D9Z4_9EUKA|nr:ornithine transcarbamylase [Harpagon schusteri]
MSKQLVHLTKISDLSKEIIERILRTAADMKKNESKYYKAMEHKTLLMFFEKPSLRTRVSLEAGMNLLGGHAIYYDVSTGPLGKKENFHDTAICSSRFADIISARLNKKEDLWELAKYAEVPVINLLDNWAHPCQMLADLLTITEKKHKKFNEMTFTYVGDVHNNVTYDLMRACAVMGMNMKVSGPNKPGFEIEQPIWDEVNELCKKSGAKITYHESAEEACTDVDIIYCDSWMSYGIPKDLEEKRKEIFMPYQIDGKKLALAHKDCIFMNCLPAARGAEQTAEVIDGPQSVVFDQAENRMWAQNALLVYLAHGESALLK